MLNDPQISAAELSRLSFGELKARWNGLFDVAPPAFNRRSLEARLVYRLQEIEHGGLKLGSRKRLLALAEELDGGDRKQLDVFFIAHVAVRQRERIQEAVEIGEIEEVFK